MYMGCKMFEIKNFDNWKPYEGASEGSGRSEKIWLISENENSQKIGLFKYPKKDPKTNQITTEHISEHLAHQLGEIINVKTAVVDIGSYNGRMGSMSYLVNSPTEALLEGIDFISGLFPGYNSEKMMDTITNKYYSIEHIFQSTQDIVSKRAWIKMMIFDFLIGNADRHQSNWAVLASYVDERKNEIQVKPCPLYDNGSSLCCYVNESQIPGYLGKDVKRMNALIDSKSKSIIRIDGTNKTKPRHSDMVRYLIANYDEAYPIADSFVSRLMSEKIETLLNLYPETLLSRQKNRLICEFLKSKIALLKIILEENGK